jgi:hypothetical protein
MYFHILGRQYHSEVHHDRVAVVAVGEPDQAKMTVEPRALVHRRQILALQMTKIFRSS